MKKRFPLHYVSAPCGAGKTTAALNFIRQNPSLNFAFVAPTTNLLSEVQKALTSTDVRPTLITSQTHPSNVKRAILKHLMDVPEDYGDILLINWEAYSTLPYIPPNKRRHVIIDEIPQLDRFFELRLPLNSHLIGDHIDVVPHLQSNSLAAVRVRARSKLESLLSKRDDCVEPLRKLFTCLLNPNMITFVDIPSWNAFNASDAAGDKTIYFLSLLNPNLLRDEILLGANVEESLVFNWLPRFFNCKFVPHNEIISSLSATGPVGPRLKIRYVLKGCLSSKTLHQQIVEGTSVIDLMDDIVIREFGSAPFLYVPNTDRKSVIDAHPNARRISPSCRGLNSYQTYSKVYFSAALNRSPVHCRMLGDLGFTHDQLLRSTAGETAYQVLMRTSLRDASSNEVVTAIIGDEQVARYVAGLTGCTDVSKLGGIQLPERPSPLTATQKGQRRTAKKARATLMQQAAKYQPNTSIKEDGIESDANDANESSKGEQLPTCRVTFHKHVTDHRPEQLVSKTISFDQLVKAFRTQARATIDRKQDQYLFNPTTFATNGTSFRSQDSFLSSFAMVLDFDNGSLSPEDFKEMFWERAKGPLRKSFIICNSFSRSPEQPNKFRVILPYRRPAKCISEHQAVFDGIVARLEQAGFSQPSAKLDPTCRSGVQSFYLPCTNRAYPDWAFFEAFGMDRREFARHAINPQFIAKLCPLIQRNEPIAIANDTFTSRDQIAVITGPLLGMTEDRHNAIHKCVFQLKARGLSDVQVRVNLPYAYEPHMRKKVSDSLKSWGKKQRLRFKKSIE